MTHTPLPLTPQMVEVQRKLHERRYGVSELANDAADAGEMTFSKGGAIVCMALLSWAAVFVVGAVMWP